MELQILIRRMYIELKQFEKENRNTEAVELRQKLADSTSKSSQLKSEYNNLEDQALRKRRQAIGKLSVVIEELEENEKEAKLAKTVAEMKPQADLYYTRGKLYEAAEQYIESVDDLEKAFALKPYVEAVVSNYTFYERVTRFMVK